MHFNKKTIEILTENLGEGFMNSCYHMPVSVFDFCFTNKNDVCIDETGNYEIKSRKLIRKYGLAKSWKNFVSGKINLTQNELEESLEDADYNTPLIDSEEIMVRN